MPQLCRGHRRPIRFKRFMRQCCLFLFHWLHWQIVIYNNATVRRLDSMNKRIAYCADGTWDTSTSHTNVYKLYKALSVGADQMPFYDDGVGASGNPILKLVGGAFG